ncbi:helix-turn-helix domain-containing protein [Fructobacillus fructosus]|uniref:helix-turn-helix domain-containing protein n=1 Tax=Fructobacillus fructosus TaxID=1631 RepID=UPI003BADBAAC
MKNNRLLKLRKQHGLSCNKLQKISGISQATISRYENGLIEGRVSVWKKLADYFEVSFEYLLGWTDEPH